MAIDLIKERAEIDNSSHACITSCLAMLEGGGEIDMYYGGLPEGTTVLRAGHPVVLLDNGKWSPCGITDGKYDATKLAGDTVGHTNVYCYGVIASDVALSDGHAPIMLIGVVDYRKSPIGLNTNFFGEPGMMAAMFGKVTLIPKF